MTPAHGRSWSVVSSGGEELIPGLDLPEPAPAPRKAATRTAARPANRKGARQAAAELPVARVAVDMSLPHLDRPFDYLVPQELAGEAVPGCRVRVRFAGQLVDG